MPPCSLPPRLPKQTTTPLQRGWRDLLATNLSPVARDYLEGIPASQFRDAGGLHCSFKERNKACENTLKSSRLESAKALAINKL